MNIKKENKPVLKHLPETGFIRLKELLVFVPFSSSTLWRKAKSGEFPAPVKLSRGITAWKAEEVRAWIDKKGVGA